MSENQAQIHRDFFLHLTGFITLYWAMVALITVLFQLINNAFPDVLAYADPSFGPLRFGLSSVIVAFPVFAGIMYFFRKREMKRPNFPIYFTLFVTAITAVVDIAVLIYHLTGGDITARFLLKMLAVLIVTGGVFVFELWNLKRATYMLDIRSRILIGLAYAIVLASVVFGFIVVGSPISRRAQQLDLRRVEHLRTIQYEVANYYSRKDQLPEVMADLRLTVMDPKTQDPYEYRKMSAERFELCAMFDEESSEAQEQYFYGGPMMGRSQDFSHDADRVCFERTVDDLEEYTGMQLK